MGLVICKTKDQILKNFQIRLEVFNKEQNVPYELDIDLAEFNGEMFLYTDESEDNYVACARIIYEKDRIHLGRVAVLKEYRGKGRRNLRRQPARHRSRPHGHGYAGDERP